MQSHKNLQSARQSDVVALMPRDHFDKLPKRDAALNRNLSQEIQHQPTTAIVLEAIITILKIAGLIALRVAI